MKLVELIADLIGRIPFSILKRIVMGETPPARPALSAGHGTFSILKRIVMGETRKIMVEDNGQNAFSILKRIVMGETQAHQADAVIVEYFQYPQADRDG